LLGIPPTGDPVAELWFDQQLPFLVKILAAERALSIQVHPNAVQARIGFTNEERLGIALNSPGRVYRDSNHKPELLCALTGFDALCGLRPVADTVRLIDALDVAELMPLRDALLRPDGLQAAVAMLLAASPADRARLIPAVAAGCDRLHGSGGEWQRETEASLSAARDFPDDIGSVLALLLNAVHLLPGEAIFLAPGQIHAYVRGVAVEIMANGDNIVRAGLTEKHVDIPEFLAIADFTSLAEPRCPSRAVACDRRVFITHACEFELAILELDIRDQRHPRDVTLPTDQLLLCAAGAVSIASQTSVLELGPGHAALVPASCAARCRGVGTVFQASIGGAMLLGGALRAQNRRGPRVRRNGLVGVNPPVQRSSGPESRAAQQGARNAGRNGGRTGPTAARRRLP
jgi:mannose-6-phosphate isomerase